MTTSLRDIPGATRDPVLLRERRRTRRRLLRGKPPVLRPAPRPALGRPPPRPRLFEHRRRIRKVDLLIAVLAVGLALFFAHSTWSATRVGVAAVGLDDGAVLSAGEAQRLSLHFEVSPPDRAERATLLVDGHNVRDRVAVRDGRVLWAPGTEIAEGRHEVELRVPRPLLGASSFHWSFTVDGTAPAIEVPRVLDPVAIDQPVTVTGRVDPDAALFLDGSPVEVEDGGFAVEFDLPPAGPIRLEAIDPAGNATRTEVIVPVRYEPVRAVHVTAAAWDHDELRAGILALVDAGRVEAVELDIKDEGGVVGHRSTVGLAREIGATKNMYDLRDAVEELHARGVRVIGRVVAFRDPILTEAAVARGRDGWVTQLADGSPHPAYGGFTNFADPAVRRYNIDVALEAVAAGVDEILYDYVRRPEGALADMVFPGLVGTPEDGIVDFLADSHRLLRRQGVPQGAAVFGIAADRPWTVGQDIPRIGRHVDYVSPMLYPSLWVKGEYSVPDPLREPYEIVKRSLADFQEKLEGTGAVLVPWLQDFTLGSVPYGQAEVRAQVQAAADLGVRGFLLWNPLARYTAEALDPAAR